MSKNVKESFPYIHFAVQTMDQERDINSESLQYSIKHLYIQN